MEVYISKRHKASVRRELTEACKLYASLLMDPRTVRNLNITIRVVEHYDTMGECLCEDDIRYPKYFTITLRQKQGDDDIIKTLAHEMVHVKQYARRELVSGILIAAKGGFKVASKWHGDIWKPKSKECGYYDSPWEIEAYGREVGLYIRWVKHIGECK